MRLRQVEFAYDVSPVSRGELTLVRPGRMDVDREGRFYIIDYPDFLDSSSYYSPGRNRSILVTYHPESCRRSDLPVPVPDDEFHADIVSILPDGNLLLVQYGQWPQGKINGLLMTPGGTIRHEYRFGECISDVAVSSDGLIFVIYNEEGYFGALREGQPLIECFDLSGKRIDRLPALNRVLDQLAAENVFDGMRIDLLCDGGLVVNGQYWFDRRGELYFSWGHTGGMNKVIIDEYDNVLFIPPGKGGLFQLFSAPGGYAELAMATCRLIDYEEYAWKHCVRGHYMYLVNRSIPKIEVFRLIYDSGPTPPVY
jgi:hypothetical protein